MKVIFVSNASSADTLNSYSQKYNKKPARYVQQWWDYSFASAMKKQLGEDFIAISFPPVATYPSSKCIRHKERTLTDENGLEIFYPGMCNLPIVKQYSLISNIKKRLKRICKSNPDEEIMILTHCVYMQSAVPSFKIRKKYKNVKVFTIVPDLPEHATSVAFDKHTLLKLLFKRFVKKNVKLSYGFDGYICFSEPQMEHLNKEKPHTVMEGFFDFSMFDGVESAQQHHNRVVYAGGLMYRYGIRELVDGFISANIPEAELYIYGEGEAKEYAKDKEQYRVYYGGCLKREDMLVEEKGVFLLVNPRPSDDEYSRCSFPSKLMEYMASGTPTLTTRLGCIGKEYEDKMSYIEDENADGIAKALKYCFENREEMLAMGKRAEKYIREEKNVNKQAKRVLDFLLENK